MLLFFHYKVYSLCRGVQLIFTGGHIGLAIAFNGPNVSLGLCKSRSSYIYTGENELDAPALQVSMLLYSQVQVWRWRKAASNQSHFSLQEQKSKQQLKLPANS